MLLDVDIIYNWDRSCDDIFIEFDMKRFIYSARDRILLKLLSL